MKRLAIIAMIVVALVIAGLAAALPLLVSSEQVRQRIVKQTRELTGQELSFTGNPSVSFSPFLGVELRDVVLYDPKASPGAVPFLKMEILRGKLQLLPALFGKIRLDEFQLVRPQFNFIKTSDGTTNWSFTNGQAPAALSNEVLQKVGDENRAKTVAIGQFKVLDATVNFDNAISGVQRTLTNLQASGYWGDTASTFTIGGTAVWDGLPVEMQLKSSNLLKLVFGGESDISLNLLSDAFDLQFSGKINTDQALFYEGQSSVRTPSLAGLARLFGYEMKGPVFTSSFFISGPIVGDGKEIKFSNAELALDENQASGVLQLREDEFSRLNVNGTIAFNELDMLPYVERFTSGMAAGFPDDVIVDARISMGRAMLGKASFDNFAAALLLRDGKLELDIGDSGFMGGRLIGNMKFMPEDGEGGLLLGTKFTLSDFDTDTLFSLFGGSKIGLAGKGKLDGELNTGFGNAHSWLSELAGKAKLRVVKGRLRGIDFARLESVISSPVDNAKQAPADLIIKMGGETDFDEFKMSVNIVKGLARFTDSFIAVGEQKLVLEGNADMRRGGLALQGELLKPGKGADASGANNSGGDPVVPGPVFFGRFLIGGTLANPVVTREPVSRAKVKGSDAQEVGSQGDGVQGGAPQ